jgi:hypothetical protein
VAGERGELLRDRARTDAPRGRTGRGERGEDGIGAGPEGELGRAVQERHARVGFECRPPWRGALRHLNVAAIGISEPEDARRPVRPGPHVPDRVLLQHDDVAPVAQRVCGREPEEAAAHDHDIRTRRPAHGVTVATGRPDAEPHRRRGGA